MFIVFIHEEMIPSTPGKNPLHSCMKHIYWIKVWVVDEAQLGFLDEWYKWRQ